METTLHPLVQEQLEALPLHLLQHNQKPLSMHFGGFMKMPRSIAWMSSVGILMVGAVCAQDYPHKPLRIVTSPIGGGNDLMARLIAQGLAGPLSQPVVVDNRPTALT